MPIAWGRAAASAPIFDQSPREEVANAIVHGVALLLCIAGAAVMIVLAALYGNAWHIVSFSVFGATLILLYASSTAYHGVRRPRPKRVLQVVDHASIYVLIAGTYTPFTLVPLNGAWGWSLFGVVWGLAAAGIVAKAFLAARYNLISTGVYVAMGWLGVVAIVPLLRSLETAGFLLLLAGGVVYTLGAGMYLWERLPFNHALWHLFVLGGSVCHYFAVVLYVLPLS